MKEWIAQLFDEYFSYVPHITVTDVVEIIIIAFVVYEIALWIKNTKAWMLLKGMLVLAVFISVAAIFQMNTILWLVKNSIGVLATVTVVVFQPELRRALEKLGERNLLSAVVPFDKSKEKEKFSQETIEGIVTATFEMAKVKTGALIVVEDAIQLTEYERTGIRLDSVVSSQLLINIFEHNTPLHDGAIIVRGDRIVAATCYLPLSDNRNLSKDLGTRHRAAVGMSEVSDALIIVVSEETGAVSYAQGGRIVRHVNERQLTEKLNQIRKKADEEKKRGLRRLWKGRAKNERTIEK
ncbi:diadenylate cyclase CdaA [Faecalimonas hominis]